MPSSAHPPLTEHSILSSYLLNPSPLPQILSFSEFVKTCVPQQHRDHPHVKRLYRDLQFQRDIDVDAVRQNIERECQRAGVLRGRLAAKVAIENGSTSSQNAEAGKKKRKRAPSTDTRDPAAALKSKNDMKVEDDDEFNNSNDIQVAEAVHQGDVHPAASSLPVIVPDKTRSNPNSTHHTTATLLDGLERSITSLKQEESDLDAQNEKLLQEMRETISQLSDLRYGRFARPLSATGDDAGGKQNSLEESVVEALQRLQSVAKRMIDD